MLTHSPGVQAVLTLQIRYSSQLCLRDIVYTGWLMHG